MAFPTSLDSFVTMNPDLPYTLGSEGHNDRHNALNTAVAALEAKVGADSSVVVTSHDYKIAALETADSAQDALIAANAADILTNAASITAVETTTGDGWTAAGETWTYSSADAPSFVFTVPTDLTTKYYPGMKVKLTQTTDKFFVITKVTFTSVTEITVYGGTDYTLANAAITSPYFSVADAPAGFPKAKSKWTEEFTDSDAEAQTPVSLDTWVNIGSSLLSIPVGAWDVGYFVNLGIESTAETNIDIKATLSTANNTESDSKWTAWGLYQGATGNNDLTIPAYRSGQIEITTKATYYLNAASSTGNPDQMRFRGDVGETIIRAVCSYI